MSIKGNVFTNSNSTKTALDTVRDTLHVDQDGSVSFKSRTGRGSGTPVEIPGENFNEFVGMMQEVAQQRETIAEQQRVATSNASSADTQVSDTDVSDVE